MIRYVVRLILRDKFEARSSTIENPIVDEDIVHAILKNIENMFDGDILNIIGMMTKELTYCFRKYDPVTRMIMSRDTGELNPYFELVKEQLINVYHYSTIQ